MGKWAVFAAHRYVWAGAAVPRTVGPDGRPLARPWRQRSEQAVLDARRIRAARPQSVLPKLLGWVCIGVACVAALVPVTPLPRHVAVSAANGPAPEQPGPALRISPLRRATAGTFSWQRGEIAGPFTFVLLDADYTQLLAVDGIAGASWDPTPAAAAHLLPGQTYHAYVIAGEEPDSVRSPLLTFSAE